MSYLSDHNEWVAKRAAARRKKVVAMRKGGMTYAEIGLELGGITPQGAAKIDRDKTPRGVPKK